MEKKLLINAREREKRWALLEGNKIKRFEVHQPDRDSKVGNVYSGVVETIKPSLNAAFVSFDKGRNGYLPLKNIPWATNSDLIQSVLHQGQRIMLQVTKDESDLKGAVVTCSVECAGSALVYFPFGKIVTISKKIEDAASRKELITWSKSLLEETEGLLIRTEAYQLTKDELEKELSRLRTVVENWKTMFQRNESSVYPILSRTSFLVSVEQVLLKEQAGTMLIDHNDTLDYVNQFLMSKPDLSWSSELVTGDENVFDTNGAGLAEESNRKKIVWIDGGISIVIEHTEALTVIDVNSGKMAKSADNRQTVKKVNERAALEVMRQLQLRDISGIIIIDFINMIEEDQRALTKTIQNRAAKDHKHIEVIGFTELCLFQLTRKKTRPSYEEIKTIQCQVCEGKGTVLSPASLAFELERELYEKRREILNFIEVEASSDVMSAFNGAEGSFSKDIAKLFGFKIVWNIIESPYPVYRINKLT
ncbi:ribonuclease E/G [Jeotgalibacillus proteolyticus]|uniref:ribonuclease E/G n=1 Tax=Jeotgalibacillus proteolyticus TaxID=2082395 RepID=UPI0014312BE4|nr:ribonuclease E/G [Jeotgalibacillus proteolyticus]